MTIVAILDVLDNTGLQLRAMEYLDIDAPIETEDTSPRVSTHDSSWGSEFPEVSQVPTLSEMANVLNYARDVNSVSYQHHNIVALGLKHDF